MCIVGGPEFPAGTGAFKIENNKEDQTYDKSFQYMIDRPYIDYFAYSDGEVAFVEIIKNFRDNNYSTKSMRERNIVIRGCVNLDYKKEKLIIGNYIPRIGLKGSVKSEGRDEIPSPYTTGLLDKFLNGINHLGKISLFGLLISIVENKLDQLFEKII